MLEEMFIFTDKEFAFSFDKDIGVSLEGSREVLKRISNLKFLEFLLDSLRNSRVKGYFKRGKEGGNLSLSNQANKFIFVIHNRELKIIKILKKTLITQSEFC